MTSNNNYKSLRDFAFEALQFPSELGQQDAPMRLEIAKAIEQNRLSTFRKSTDVYYDLPKTV